MNRTNAKNEWTSPTRVFESLANFFDTRPEGNLIKIPAHIGSGNIHQVMLSSGLIIRCWDVSLLHPMDISTPLTESGPGRFFNLSYILTPDHFCLDSGKLNRSAPQNGNMHLLFASDDHPLSYHLQPINGAKAIAISITTDWLINEFNITHNVFHDFIKEMIAREDPSLFYEPVPFQQTQLLNDLHQHFVSGSQEALYIRIKALTLLSEFLHGLFMRCTDKTDHIAIPYHDNIKLVEAILREHLYDHLPGIQMMARQVGLSESTLKRYFHQAHNTSIYEYYLQLKMEHARELLTLKKMPVKEVAYTLGYEKASSFIRMFRKHYINSPGFFKGKKWIVP